MTKEREAVIRLGLVCAGIMVVAVMVFLNARHIQQNDKRIAQNAEIIEQNKQTIRTLEQQVAQNAQIIALQREGHLQNERKILALEQTVSDLRRSGQAGTK
jgi:cell division protein FtsL